MKKQLCALLALILLFCAAACGGGAATDEPKEPMGKPVESLSAFSISENLNTAWYKSVDTDTYPYYCNEELYVYEGGEAILTHDGVWYRLVETGETCRLEKDLYASPFDETPAQTLDAGEVRLLADGAKVCVEVLSDPLGIFEGFPPEDLSLSLNQSRHPTRYYAHTPHASGHAPHFQPETGWYERAGHRKTNGGSVYYTNCRVTARADGTVRGTVQVTDESQEEDCVLLWAGDAGALVRPDGELLYYGKRMWLSRFERDDCAEYVLKANYDPLHLSVGNMLILYRGTDSTEPRDVIGRSRAEIIDDFTADGWTHEPLSMSWGEGDDDNDNYGELFIKLTKDGRMLLIYLDWDIVGRFADEWFAYAYVLIGADGTLESWGGQKPGDHTLADSYKLSDEFPFNGGLWGLWEDDRVLLLDDGRIFVTYEGHESGKVLDFIIFDPRG
jgi:hypothetical protein